MSNDSQTVRRATSAEGLGRDPRAGADSPFLPLGVGSMLSTRRAWRCRACSCCWKLGVGCVGMGIDLACLASTVRARFTHNQAASSSLRSRSDSVSFRWPPGVGRAQLGPVLGAAGGSGRRVWVGCENVWVSLNRKFREVVIAEANAKNPVEVPLVGGGTVFIETKFYEEGSTELLGRTADDVVYRLTDAGAVLA